MAILSGSTNGQLSLKGWHGEKKVDSPPISANKCDKSVLEWWKFTLVSSNTA